MTTAVSRKDAKPQRKTGAEIQDMKLNALLCVFAALREIDAPWMLIMLCH
jgi:hypothetical protein